MGGIGSGVSKTRWNAIALVRERGWSIGTELHSSSWTVSRTIVALSAKRVRLKGHGTPEFVSTFPYDVHVL